MADKPAKPEAEVLTRNQQSKIRIQYLSTLPDKQLNQLIEKSRGLF
jgi:hypothetical protein